MSKSSLFSKMKSHGSGGTGLNNIKKAIRKDSGITADVKKEVMDQLSNKRGRSR